ncbi:MAG: glycosyltransferase [Planctomycetaceae bacterium]
MPLIVAGMPAAGTALVVDCLRACGVRFPDGCGAGPTRLEPESPLEPWGRVDAAGSLALPVWLAEHPTARVVACLRNPFEVAMSLHRRHGLPLDAGLALWRRHADTLLGATTAARRVVVHYDDLRRDAVAATGRLAAALGLPLPNDRVTVGRVWRTSPASRFTAHDLVACGLDAATLDAYRRLCAEAGHADDAGRSPADQHAARDDLRVLAEACRRLQPATPAADRTTPAADLTATVAALREELARLHDRLDARDADLHDLLDDLRHDAVEGQPPEKRGYRRVMHGIRQLLRDRVPAGGVVAIVSRGDDELLRQRRCTAWHFPRDQRGGYLGYHPAGDLAAIANLETTRAAGATHLLIPETHAWWLTSYPGFRSHLDRHARLIEERPAAGLLFDLAIREHAPPSPAERIAAALGRAPHVLAWRAPAAAAAFPGSRIFEPPAAGDRLPYIDQSVDVVAVQAPTDADLAEARRVAIVAVVDVAGEPVVDWLNRPTAAEPPSVSIVIPVHGHWPVTQACLRGLLPSLPQGWPVEVVIVDDASPDETPERLAEIAAGDHRLVILRNEANEGFVGSCNRGAAAATGDYLVFLNNDTVPLPGWLPPLIRTFDAFPSAGAVGGKLLFPDGRLQEAGGVIFADASACHVGREHPDPAATPFCHVRPVDYVSGALVATPRDVFAALGGFDPAFAPGYYEDTDYCFRLRACGREVLFQPEATVVHVEGGTAGTDHAVGMKRYQEINRRRFQSRHAAALMRQRARPAAIDRDTWLGLIRPAAAEAR